MVESEKIKFEFDFSEASLSISKDVVARCVKTGRLDFLKKSNSQEDEKEFENYKELVAVIVGLSAHIADQTLQKYHNQLAKSNSINV